MLKKILIALLALVALLAVVVAMQPAEFRVARTAVIAAPAPAVFPLVNDFHKWQAWSPWEGLDPAMKRSYEGAPSGTGAVYTWSGNDKVGEGRMTITDSRPSELVRLRLEFFKPFKATDTGEFTFIPRGEQTAVTWSMSGQNNFMFKAVHLFMNMDKMLGDEFDKGLARMKSAAEAAGKK